MARSEDFAGRSREQEHRPYARNERAFEERFEQAQDRGGESQLRSGLYTRALILQSTAGPATITVQAPERYLNRARRAVLLPWAISLAMLVLFLASATFLQLRIGLQPFERLKLALKAVRDGHAERVPEDQPEELRAVVSELNHLLAENTAALARARGHLANLAHSLKTPLAKLRLELGEIGGGSRGDVATYFDQIDGTIRHHLARARAASPGGPGTLSVKLGPVFADLIAAMSRIHAERKITAQLELPADLAVRCDRQDLEEMLGNLLDNAWHWARTKIDISVAAHGAIVTIHIDDDGPGLAPESIDRALLRGQRLDEQHDGHGFGLPIARELAELHGGALDLGESPLGGLRVSLSLPG
jgi:signal transduction histidine kinase